MSIEQNAQEPKQEVSGSPKGAPEWAVKLVDEFEGCVQKAWSMANNGSHRAYFDDAKRKLNATREALIQVLANPVRSEEDDFLSVRDQFAMAALQGFCVQGGTKSVMIREAYELADAMLKARREA